jgi:hypothetical protein
VLAHVARAGPAMLVDADARRRPLTSILSPEPASARAAARIQLLPEGELGPAAERGEAGWVERLLETLAATNDIVLVDAPSPSESADAFEFATNVDRALVVVSLGRTRQDLLGELMRTLANAGVAAGFVVVGRKSARGQSESIEGTAQRATLTASG